MLPLDAGDVLNGNFEVLLIKTDFEGNEQWNQTFGGSDGDIGYSVQQTTDGGYIICGVIVNSPDDGYDDVYLIKTDSQGNQEWSQNYEAVSIFKIRNQES